MTNTLMLDEMGGVRRRSEDFRLFIRWLAFAGMSGFVAELMVFVGFSTAMPHPTFKLMLLMAVGVILTPVTCSRCCGDFLWRREQELTAQWMRNRERYLSLPVCWCQLLALVCI